MRDSGIDLDAILLQLGSFGRYQIRNYCLILIPILFSAIYIGQYVFAAGALEFRCKVPECETDPPQFNPEWANWALPEGKGRCHRLLPTQPGVCSKVTFHPNETIACDEWVYESRNTIVAEFDLACEEWKRTLVGTVHSAGMFAALPLTSYMSDAFGRRTVFVISSTMAAVMGLVRSLSTNYSMYLVFEFLDATLGSGVFNSGFILAVEMVRLNRRVMTGNIISCTFALGQVAVALVAWAVPEWRTFTRVIYAPSLLFIFYFFLIEESARWLISKGNQKQAVEIIFKVAKANKKELNPNDIKKLTEEAKKDESLPQIKIQKEEDSMKEYHSSLTLEVIKSKILMTRLCICSFWWITLAFIYYGLSINSVSLAGNPYVNYILTALVEIPGYALSFITLDRFGRKYSIMTAFLICGISLISIPFIPGPSLWPRTALTMVGKLCISMSFSSIYIYTSELFPTAARHRLLGACSMFGRIGSIVAPQTPLLMAYMESLPYLVFGIMACTSGFLMIFTPETLDIRLPDTVNQAENIERETRNTHVAKKQESSRL